MQRERFGGRASAVARSWSCLGWLMPGIFVLAAAGCGGDKPAMQVEPDAAVPEPDAAMPAFREPEPPPVEDQTPRPASYGLRVVNLAGQPIAGAVVNVGGIGLRTNPEGDVLFAAINPGTWAATIGASGYASNTRRVTLADGAAVAEVVVLQPVGASVTLAGSSGGTLSHSGVTVVVPANKVKDLQGNVVTGAVQLKLTGFRPQEDGFRAFPAGFEALDTQGQLGVLQTFGAFEAELRDDVGRPLFLTEDGTVQASVELPAGTPLQVGDEVPMWSLDMGTGLWQQEPGVVATVVQDGAKLLLVADLPHLSTWNFDYYSPTRGCVTVSYPGLDWTSGSFDLRLDLLVEGQKVRSNQGRIKDAQVQAVGMPVGAEVQAAVLAGTRVIGSGSVTSAANCPALALTLPGLFQPVGSGPYDLEHRLLAGICPGEAAPVHIVLTRAGEAPIAMDITGHRVFQGLTAGSWSIDVYASAGDVGGTPLDQVVVELPPSVADCPEVNRRGDRCLFFSSHSLPESYAVTPPGGCVLPPCRGAECHTCVDVLVTDGAGEPAGGEFVSFYRPIEKAHASDDSGQVCVDVATGADAQLMIKTESSPLPVSVVLPRQRSCAGGGCARRTLRASESGGISCPTDHLLLAAKGLELGMRDPGFTTNGQYPTGDPMLSSFLLNVTAGQLPGIYASSGTSYGFVRIDQDLLGIEHPGPLVLRNHDVGAQKGISIELHNFGLPFGRVTLPGAADSTLPWVEVVVDDLNPQQVSRTVYRAAAGTIDVFGTSPLSATMQLQLQRVQGTGGGDTASVTVTVMTPIYSQADTPLAVSNQKSHGLNGQTLRVFTEADFTSAAAGSLPVLESGISYGPTGSSAVDPFNPEGEVQYCVPRSGWYMLVGEASPGRLRPFTALQRFLPASGSTPNRIGLAGNDDPGAWQYATSNARWFDDQFVRAIYTNNGLTASSMYTSATVLGSGRTIDGNGNAVSALVKRATLTPGGGVEGEVLEAKIMDNDFRFQVGAGNLFVFVNVPTISTWYELAVHDENDQPIPGFQQRIMPVPGGIMVAVP